ncbi:SHOCT domain-containing protein [Bacillus cereus]
MEVQQGIPKNAPLYIEMKQLVEQWHGLFSVVINRNEKENNQTSSEKSSSDTKYIADELIKLKGLLQEELITKEEFEKQKRKTSNVSISL